MKTETNVIALSIFIGLIVWIIDAVLDYFIFYEGTFLDLLIFDVPNHEIYIRSVVLFIFAIFGMIISQVMIKRKQVEEALRLERDNFINILDTMEDGVCIVDQQYNLQYVNPTLMKNFGLSEGYKCYEYFHDRKEFCPWCRNQEVFAGKSVHWEWYSFKNNRTYDLIDTPLNNLDGSISKLEILHDITNRKQAEETLRLRSEMLENMGEGVYLIRTDDGIIVYANPRFEEMFGYESGEMIGQHVSIVNATTDVSPEDKVDVIMEKLRKDGVWHGDIQNIKKDGTTFWCHANVSVFDHSEYGEVLVSVHEDITQRKETEESLKRYAAELELNKKRLDALLQLTHMTENSFDEIVHFVLNEGAELTNSKFGFIGLMNEDESVLTVHAWTKDVMDACNVDDKPVKFIVEEGGVWVEPLRQRKNVIINDYESTEFHKKGVPDGHIPLSRLIGIPIFEGDRIVALASMANKQEEYNETDAHQLTLLMEGMWRITQRKETEEKLKQYAEDLKCSNELKDLFTDILRHDLLNPAGIIKGYTELLLDLERDEKKVQTLQKIEHSNEKLIDIIETASRFAKLESIEELEFETKDIAVIIKGVADNFRPQIENRQMALEFKVEGTYPANVNPVIEEVFANLLSNAIKYSSQKNKIIVDIIDAGDMWKVTVTDFGEEGISNEDKTALFERFKRVGKGSVKGTGLGLAIVKRIIELHGGSVGVEDNPAGVGSVFWVTVGKV